MTYFTKRTLRNRTAQYFVTLYRAISAEHDGTHEDCHVCRVLNDSRWRFNDLVREFPEPRKGKFKPLIGKPIPDGDDDCFIHVVAEQPSQETLEAALALLGDVMTKAEQPYWADLNPGYGAKGEMRYAVFYRNHKGRIVLIEQYKTLRGAESVAKRYNDKPGLPTAE